MHAIADQGLKIYQWAWEFLRRNENYRALMAPYFQGDQMNSHFARTVPEEVVKKLRNEFWLQFPVNPALPSHAFQYWYWSAEKVPVSAKIKPYDEEGKKVESPVIMYVRPNAPRQVNYELLKSVLDELGVPEDKQAWSSHKRKKKNHKTANECYFKRHLIAYDLWYIHIHPFEPSGYKKYATMTWPEIGAISDPTYKAGAATLQTRAIGAKNAARRDINGGYKKFLLGDMFMDTPFEAPPSPNYLGRWPDFKAESIV